MATPNNYPHSSKASDTSSSSNREKDQSQIRRILHEVGLNPSDYAFSPAPGDQSPSNHFQNYPSAFSTYSPRASPPNHSGQLIHHSRPVSYVQQPAPGTSGGGAFASLFGSQSSNQGQNPPPQPPPPPQQPPSSQPSAPGPFASLFNFQPSQQGQNQAPSQAPPPPTSAQTPFTSLFTSQPPPAAQQPPNQQATSQGSENNTADMNHHSFSPRRTPPPPPHFSGYQSDTRLSAEHYLREINSQEVPPVKVIKPNTQNLVYRKEIRIRYLQPPTPAPPAPIIIREKHAPPIPPQSPLLIRERKPEARTPPPLTIRERPPTPPAPLEPYVIEKNIPPLPPQPRQIIIERLPTPPPKPRTVIFEKWLPYKKVKRPVLLQKAPPLEPVKPTRNVVIEYEPLKAFTVRRVIEEGVFRVDPHEYTSYNNHPNPRDGDVRIVERIEDLPPPSDQLMRVLDEYNQPVAAQSVSRSYHHESEHVPTSIQHLLADARPVSNADHLISIARTASTPAHQSQRVLSTGYNSSNPSPTVVPLERSRSKHSYRYPEHFSPRDSPATSQVGDIY